LQEVIFKNLQEFIIKLPWQSFAANFTKFNLVEFTITFTGDIICTGSKQTKAAKYGQDSSVHNGDFAGHKLTIKANK
jgi:hypothetical protein